MEQYGFDEYINIAVQPRGKFIDIKEGAKAFENVVFGQTILVPAESDILVQFAPARMLPSSTAKEHYMGRMRMRTWH